MIADLCLLSLREAGYKGNSLVDYNNFPTLDVYIKKNIFSYYEAVRLIMCLGIQLAKLNMNSKSILYLTPKNIVRLDENWYVITNTENIVDIENNNNISIKKPITITSEYAAPELRKKFCTIPAEFNISCIYYSIALLVKKLMNINDALMVSTIVNSQLYYFLERCMIKDPVLRRYVFI